MKNLILVGLVILHIIFVYMSNNKLNTCEQELNDLNTSLEEKYDLKCDECANIEVCARDCESIVEEEELNIFDVM